MPLFPSRINDIRVTAHKSCALAAQTFMIAMANEGYDTCPLEGLDSRRLKRTLKLPHGAEITWLFLVGYGMEIRLVGETLQSTLSMFIVTLSPYFLRLVISLN